VANPESKKLIGISQGAAFHRFRNMQGFGFVRTHRHGKTFCRAWMKADSISGAGAATRQNSTRSLSRFGRVARALSSSGPPPSYPLNAPARRLDFPASRKVRNIDEIHRLISREIYSAFRETTSRNDLSQRVASINAIPQATVIYVVAYF
jgi:hypothetical protein